MHPFFSSGIRRHARLSVLYPEMYLKRSFTAVPGSYLEPGLPLDWFYDGNIMQVTAAGAGRQDRYREPTMPLCFFGF